MNVFVSYSRRDQDFALRLVGALRRWGHNPWLDLEQIPKGANWPDEIDKGLEAADVVVGVLSENSMASGMVKNEWDYALVNSKPLIPVQLRSCKVSHRYVRINYVDCANDERTGLELLQKALRSPETSFKDGLVDTERRQAKGVESAKQRVTNRATMLQKVHDFWIKGVLEPAKLGDVWLDLSAEQCPEAVEPEVKRELHNPDFNAFALGASMKIADVFHRMGRELLILGAPGSGKTITLLELARDLIAQAQTDATAPIPVVLNLASWAEKHAERMEDWLVERLFVDYGVPRKVGQQWIENGVLLFLLDGLDEVPLNFRDMCVTAINAFWRRYDQVDNGIAVCSRIADYERLTTALHLENAIVLKSLTLAQADAYLLQLGPTWDELRTAIPNDGVLRELVESPLLLNIMAVAYRNTPRDQIMGLSEINQKRQLFERYVVRRLHDGPAPEKYPNTKTQHYLCWLAQQMATHGQTVFQIEGIVPTWLDAQRQRQQYRQGIRVYIGLIGGLIFGLISGLVSGLIFGLAGGPGLGLVGGLVGGLLVGVASGLGFGLFGEQIGHLFFGLGSRVDRDRIFTTEKLDWSWEGAKNGLLSGLVCGLIVGLFGNLVIGPVVGLVLALFVWLSIGLFGGLIGASIEQRTSPNEGIWRSLNHALFGSLVIGLAVGSFFGVVVGLTSQLLFGLLVGLVAGMIVGLVFGLQRGGVSVIYHLILRRIFYRAGSIPLNYAEFLDYCASRNLLRRVGGGYIFRHRMLLEFFAEKNE